MSGGVFISWANVEHGHETVLQAPRELLPRNRLQFIKLLEVAGNHTAHLRGPALRDLLNGRHGAQH